jgi:hypothetical protein
MSTTPTPTTPTRARRRGLPIPLAIAGVGVALAAGLAGGRALIPPPPPEVRVQQVEVTPRVCADALTRVEELKGAFEQFATDVEGAGNDGLGGLSGLYTASARLKAWTNVHGPQMRADLAACQAKAKARPTA